MSGPAAHFRVSVGAKWDHGAGSLTKRSLRPGGDMHVRKEVPFGQSALGGTSASNISCNITHKCGSVTAISGHARGYCSTPSKNKSSDGCSYCSTTGRLGGSAFASRPIFQSRAQANDFQPPPDPSVPSRGVVSTYRIYLVLHSAY